MGFSRQEYWSGLPFPSPGIFQTQGLNPGLLHCRLTRLTHACIFQTCAVHLGFSPWNSVVTVFAQRRCCASFRPGFRMISRLEGHEWQRPGWSSYFLRFLSRERPEDSGENRDGKENKSIPAWGAGRGENGDRLWELPANIWFPALLGGEEASLPKSGRPNTIAKATPIGPQTANTAAEPVRHLGKPPEFLETSL